MDADGSAHGGIVADAAPFSLEWQRDVASALRALRRGRPRVHALTSVVAANLTANVLLAAGADPSMTQDADDLPDLIATADALLLNLGMLDRARRDAIAIAAPLARAAGKPIVLDPVYIDRAGPRRRLALSLAEQGVTILKLNRAEALALPPGPGTPVRVETGTIDRIDHPGGSLGLGNGSCMLARVTATGCALGAVMAACAAVAPPAVAALAALGLVNVAAEDAARAAVGPGSFVPLWIDAIATLDADEVALRLQFVEEDANP